MTSPIGNECLQLSDDDRSTVAARARAMWEEAGELAAKRHYRRAVQKALSGAALCESIGDKVHFARMLGRAGEICQMAHHDRAAAFYYWKALRSLGKNDLFEKHWIWGCLARIYRQFWNFTRAQKYNRIHLRLSMEQNNVLQTGYAHLGLGLNHYYQENWVLALEHTQKALDIFGPLGEPRLEFAARLNMACIYNASKERDKARAILEEILAPDKPSPNAAAVCAAYEELGRVYLRTGDFAKYQEARSKTAEWASLSKSLVDMGRVVMLDAECSWLQGQRTKAIKTARKAIGVFRNHGAVSSLHVAEKMLVNWLKEEVSAHENRKKARSDPDSGGHASGPRSHAGIRRSGGSNPARHAAVCQRDHDRQVGPHK
ncbi:MAG: tetratricopeptide repeat protein [Bacillota bacterium]